MHEEEPHDELKDEGLTCGVARQPLHHVSVSRQACAVDLLPIQTNFLSLHNEEEELLRVSQVRGAEDKGRAE